DPLAAHVPFANGGTYPRGVSGTNVVGFFVDASHATHGFLYNGTTYTTLDYPGSTLTQAFGVQGNNIVGEYIDSSQNEHGFLYNGTNWMTLDEPLATTATFH